MSAMPFNKEIDYQEKINKAVADGNLPRAAILEKQRNAKIEAGFGGGEAQTNNYEKYAPGYMPPGFLEKEYERRKAEAKKKEFMEKYKSVMDEKWAKENAASAQSAKGALNLNEYNAASGLNSGARMQQVNTRSRLLGDYINSVDKSAEEKVDALRKTYASVLKEDPENAEEQTEDGAKTAVPAEEGGSANAEGGESDTAKNDKTSAGGIINAVNTEGSARPTVDEKLGDTQPDLQRLSNVYDGTKLNLYPSSFVDETFTDGTAVLSRRYWNLDDPYTSWSGVY